MIQRVALIERTSSNKKQILKIRFWNKTIVDMNSIKNILPFEKCNVGIIRKFRLA